MEQPTMMDRERELELEMAGLGRERFLRSILSATQEGHETTSPGAHTAMRAAIQPVSDAVRTFVETKAARGQPSKALRYLSRINPDVVAFLTAKTILDTITMRRAVMQTALAIASALEDEDRFSTFSRENHGIWEWEKRKVQDSTHNRSHQRRVLMANMSRRETLWQTWPLTDKLHVGQKCLDMFIRTTGMVSIAYRRKRRDDTLAFLEPAESLLAMMADRNQRSELLSPTYMPTIVPPQRWSAPYTGGYWFLHRRLPIIKTNNREYLSKLDSTAMQPIYDAVNAMQETGWKVNNRVLDVLNEVWDRDLGLGGTEFKVHQNLPLCPVCQQLVDREKKDHPCFNDPENKDQHKVWKRAASKVHAANSKNRSKQLQVAKVLWVAEKFKQEAAIYFPMQMDFRGRVYALPMFLGPQGADWAKGMLHFAEGKAITDDRAQGWLMIHGANTYGFDKVSLEDRVAWTEKHTQDILRCAEDPLSNTWWSDADKPWQFLAFCFEYATFVREGFGFVSHLAVALDGSCNGLQHFSAMLRDPIGGKAVNLVPDEKPQDIYQTVCDRVIVKLKDDGGEVAAKWLALNPDRALTKRPVMTMPYGSTMFSCREYVSDWLTAQGSKPWGDDSLEAEVFMAKLIWQSIGEVVVAARKAMAWLQKAARVAAADGLPVAWTTPDGFPVLQAYAETKARRVKTIMGDTVMKLQLQEYTDKIDKRKQAGGISPNYVHSLDACALRLYVLLAKANGVTSFALVHDSYGTHAADTDMSAACLREAFVDMYLGSNHLETFREALAGSVTDVSKLPPLPPMGDLDLDLIRQAEYFFA